jgi:hypothetical protein
VDAAGAVLGTVFAEITNAPLSGLAVPDSVVRLELARARRARHAVSTQGCAE